MSKTNETFFRHMVTSAADKTVKTWDLRMLSGPLQEYHLFAHANNLALSDKGLLALSMGNIVEVRGLNLIITNYLY